MTVQTVPLVALTAGDPAGIGPEIVRACLARRAGLRILAIGPEAERPRDVPLVEDDTRIDFEGEAAWLAIRGSGDVERGRPQAAGGRAAIAALEVGARLAHAGRVDALVTAPVSKEALHLAGEEVEGQTQLLARWAGVDDVEMLAIAGRLRVLLLTRHLPLRQAIDAITSERVRASLRTLDAGLRRLGHDRPRLALAGLNPHAGEAGLLGSEERELLAPAVAGARAEGIDVAGPEPPDTVFLRARDGAFDGVLALYHDQAFIPVKLAAPLQGLTVLLGLPYLRVSPAHGTAFDIAGTGRADPRNLALALEEAARLSRYWSSACSRA